MKARESYVARRRFLCRMLGGGAATLGAVAALPVIQYTGNLREVPPPEFVVLDEADATLSPGDAKMVAYGHVPVLLLRPQEAPEELRVFVATCTHLNCTVSYQSDGDRIYCACHEGYYDTRGEVLFGPPPSPLRQLHSKFLNGRLVLALEKENLEKAS